MIFSSAKPPKPDSLRLLACNAAAYLASAGGAWPQGLFEKPHGPLAGIKQLRRRRFLLFLPTNHFREPFSAFGLVDDMVISCVHGYSFSKTVNNTFA